MDQPIWDAHQHFWQLSRGDYAWPTAADTCLYRDYTPGDLAPGLAASGVRRTVVVQATPTVAETRWLLALAETTPFVAGVVGWVDLASPEAPKTLDALRTSPYLVGIRPMLQGLADPQWIVQPQVRANLAYCATVGLRVDWLVTPRELPAVAAVAADLPDLYHIVDHLAKPSGLSPEWLDAMASLAAHPHGYCKLSGLSTFTEAAGDALAALDAPWKFDAVHRVWDWFGPDRLVFGSDWPVCLSGGISYPEAIAMVRHMLPSQDPEHLAAVFGRNAQAFYVPSMVATESR